MGKLTRQFGVKGENFLSTISHRIPIALCNCLFRFIKEQLYLSLYPLACHDHRPPVGIHS